MHCSHEKEFTWIKSFRDTAKHRRIMDVESTFSVLETASASVAEISI